MREIKFRAWYQGQMYFVAELEFNSKGVYMASLVDKDGQYTYQTNDMPTIELMQYTGLKDCKGQEIYEGDIVIEPVTAHRCVVRVSNHLTSFIADHDGSSTSLGGYAVATEKMWEVIGNIYEHPQLLEG